VVGLCVGGVPLDHSVGFLVGDAVGHEVGLREDGAFVGDSVGSRVGPLLG
jgi:hypothetical protein